MECITIQNNKKCNGASEASRLSYLDRISCEYSKKRDFELELPSADEARSFDEALSHVVRLFPNKGDGDSTAPFTGSKACSSKSRLKDSLEEILNALQWMERRRMYDPPAHHEIGFYLLIKKYARAIFAFFSVRTGLDQMFDDNYHCSSDFHTLHQVDELVELNRYFADFSAFMSELNIEDGSVIKPLMGIRDNYEVSPLIHGSKERSHKFYRHKFGLALSDMHTLESAMLPPFAEEERSYLRVLGHILSHPSAQTKDEVSVYSEELYRLFLEKMEREASDMLRHCTSIRKSLLDKISIHESWEYLEEIFKLDGNGDKLSRILTEKCQVPDGKLNNYVTCVERCRDIAHGVSLIVDERLTAGCDELTKPTYNWPDTMRIFGWEALHVLTLLKHGSFSPGNVFRENVLLRDSKSGNVRMKLECTEAKMGIKRCAQGNGNESVNMKLKCKEAKIGLKRCAQHFENENVRVVRVNMGLEPCGQGRENENVKTELKKMGLKRCGQGSEDENLKKKLKCGKANMGLKRCAQGIENENMKMKKLKCVESNIGLKCCAQGSENENVRVLRGIVEELRRIGESDILPDTEEYVLMHKIWYSVASSVHFFFSAMAYEQRRYVTRQGESLDVKKIGVRKMKRTRKDCTDPMELRSKAYQVRDLLYISSNKMEYLYEILRAYGRRLRDKLEPQAE